MKITKAEFQKNKKNLCAIEFENSDELLAIDLNSCKYLEDLILRISNLDVPEEYEIYDAKIYLFNRVYNLQTLEELNDSLFNLKIDDLSIDEIVDLTASMGTDLYCSLYHSKEEYAKIYLENVEDDIPESIRDYVSIDWESLANDLLTTFDYYELPDGRLLVQS